MSDDQNEKAVECLENQVDCNEDTYFNYSKVIAIHVKYQMTEENNFSHEFKRQADDVKDECICLVLIDSKQLTADAAVDHLDPVSHKAYLGSL